MDSGSEPGPRDSGGDGSMDAEITSPPVDADIDDDATGPDSGPDDDEGVPDPDPCSNGTFRCKPLSMMVRANYYTPATGAVLTVQVGEHSFEGVSENGFASLMVPAGRWLLVRAQLNGHWDSVVPVMIPAEATAGDGFVGLYTGALLQSAVMDLGVQLDDRKSFVSAAFSPKVVGAGFEIGSASGPAYVGYDWVPELSNQLLETSEPYVNYPNVEPGPLAITPFAPDGVTCAVVDQGALAYIAEPRTVLLTRLTCAGSAPP